MFLVKTRQSYFWGKKNWSKKEKISGVFQKLGILWEGLAHENSSEAAEFEREGGDPSV